MVFDKNFIIELFSLVERRGLRPFFNLRALRNPFSFYKVFLREVDPDNGSGASEYELYLNYMLLNHPNEIILRPLAWRDVGSLNEIDDSLDYASLHHHTRDE